MIIDLGNISCVGLDSPGYSVSLKIEKLDEGVYLATSDSVQGLVAQGRTIAETVEIARDVARKLIESHIEHGDPLPEVGGVERKKINIKRQKRCKVKMMLLHLISILLDLNTLNIQRSKRS